MKHLERLNDRGATVTEYIVLVFLMTVSIFAVIDPIGKKISGYFDYLSFEVAAMQEHIATVSVEMDEVTGSWVITEVSEDTKVAEEDDTSQNGPDTSGEEGDTGQHEADTSHDGGEGPGGGDTVPGDPEDETKLGSDTGTENGETLYGDGQSGSDPPEEEDVVPEFRLTMNNGINHAAIDFSKINVPHRFYEFTLSGTGDSAPEAVAVSSGDPADGWTLIDKIQIRIVKPKKNRIEHITLIINGQTITWDVRHDHRGGTTPNKKK